MLRSNIREADSGRHEEQHYVSHHCYREECDGEHDDYRLVVRLHGDDLDEIDDKQRHQQPYVKGRDYRSAHHQKQEYLGKSCQFMKHSRSGSVVDDQFVIHSKSGAETRDFSRGRSACLQFFCVLQIKNEYRCLKY